MFKKVALMVVLLAVPGVALADRQSVDLREPRYANNPLFGWIPTTTVRMEWAAREGQFTNVVGAAQVVTRSVQVGDVITVTYFDGTSERFVVISLSSTVQGVPIAGTQKDQNGNPIPEACEGCQTEAEIREHYQLGPVVGGGSNEGGGGFWSSVGNWFSNLWNSLTGGRTGQVEVGEIEPVPKGK